MIELLKDKYKIPKNGFQAFSGPGEYFKTTLQDLNIPEDTDSQEAISFIGKLMEFGSKILSIINKKVFRFDRAFPFTIGATDGPNGPKFRKLLIEKLQKMLEEL